MWRGKVARGAPPALPSISLLDYGKGSVVSEPVDIEIPRDPSAGRRARRLIEDLASGRLDAGELSRAKLLVSELVNNAVVHGQGTITFRVDLNEDRLLVEVIDEGSGFERAVREQDDGRLGGRGLKLVEAESSRWGVHEGTTHVWFEIERPGPRLGAEKNPLAAE
jgi:anti-sigma regulatory factor (Ser/Thr protein kinase)